MEVEIPKNCEIAIRAFCAIVRTFPKKSVKLILRNENGATEAEFAVEAESEVQKDDES